MPVHSRFTSGPAATKLQPRVESRGKPAVGRVLEICPCRRGCFKKKNFLLPLSLERLKCEIDACRGEVYKADFFVRARAVLGEG